MTKPKSHLELITHELTSPGTEEDRRVELAAELLKLAPSASSTEAEAIAYALGHAFKWDNQTLWVQKRELFQVMAILIPKAMQVADLEGKNWQDLVANLKAVNSGEAGSFGSQVSDVVEGAKLVALAAFRSGVSVPATVEPVRIVEAPVAPKTADVWAFLAATVKIRDYAAKGPTNALSTQDFQESLAALASMDVNAMSSSQTTVGGRAKFSAFGNLLTAASFAQTRNVDGGEAAVAILEAVQRLVGEDQSLVERQMTTYGMFLTGTAKAANNQGVVRDLAQAMLGQASRIAPSRRKRQEPVRETALVV